MLCRNASASKEANTTTGIRSDPIHMNYFSFSCSRTLVLSDGSILPLSQVHDHCKHSSSAYRCDACQRHHGGFCTYFTKRGHSVADLFATSKPYASSY
ncbi:hypothetical protein M438DRAFT_178379 [Aureobasidium pullulans EXF-150]|uniref:Uncharacterized protein n=1 Tax=Aureobasidium pullulans EXF-150 TaxID=1043002 RepID=A0A074XSF0_AURPU|nr:uncharacterized protein M438DRAFT_178379 [Aureobasidium pullulans EXF-150]KEQ86559.1 hypothetical protein M438DRAFT_178379 [Aureobasidium pullulans EXF-150]